MLTPAWLSVLANDLQTSANCEIIEDNEIEYGTVQFGFGLITFDGPEYPQLLHK